MIRQLVFFGMKTTKIMSMHFQVLPKCILILKSAELENLKKFYKKKMFCGVSNLLFGWIILPQHIK